jgi:hypothetical protein
MTRTTRAAILLAYIAGLLIGALAVHLWHALWS